MARAIVCCLQIFHFSTVNLARLPIMLSPQVALAIPVCAAVYLLAVYLLLVFAQSDRLSRRVSRR